MSDASSVLNPSFLPVAPPATGFVCRLSGRGVGVASVYVAAELDIASAPELERVLRRAELRAPLVVLDLRDLTFMDSRGLHVILCASNRARSAGRRLVLLRGPSQVQRLLTVSGAADRLEIFNLAESEPAIQVLLQTARTDECSASRSIVTSSLP